MEFTQIKELIALINGNEITEVEIEKAGFKIRIRKGPAVIQSSAIPETIKEIADADTQSQDQGGRKLMEFFAPMVGTFYRAPAPNEPPYIQIGDRIQEGQVLFIIEAMKMMNEIVAENSGVVKEFLVENGQPVEYGQPLLLIDPLG